jgi:hypothetical protein
MLHIKSERWLSKVNGALGGYRVVSKETLAASLKIVLVFDKFLLLFL